MSKNILSVFSLVLGFQLLHLSFKNPFQIISVYSVKKSSIFTLLHVLYSFPKTTIEEVFSILYNLALTITITILPLSLGNIILLKEKGAIRESFHRQVDKKSRGPQGERGLEFSRRKKAQTFFSSTFLRIMYLA